MSGTTSTALSSFSHDQRHETDAAKRKGGGGCSKYTVQYLIFQEFRSWRRSVGGRECWAVSDLWARWRSESVLRRRGTAVSLSRPSARSGSEDRGRWSVEDADRNLHIISGHSTSLHTKAGTCRRVCKLGTFLQLRGSIGSNFGN